jgi:hydroxymethylbilane synthase
MRRLRIASRPSKLALAQASLVADMLRKVAPGLEIDIVEVTTTGDRDNRDFLSKAPTVGFFTSEVEQALVDRRADIAVHSLKDLPTAPNPSLIVAAIPPREEVCDVVISSHPAGSLADLPHGARVGTSSLRRTAQLLHTRGDLKCLPIRGNVETRIAKLDRGDYDAIVLAAAGLNRLHLAGRISLRLRPEEFLVAPGQGALAVQVRADATDVIACASRIDHMPTRLVVEAERHVLAALHGGCSIPLGVFSSIDAQELRLSAVLASPDGKEVVRTSLTGAMTDGMELAGLVAAELLAQATPAIRAVLKPQT